MHVLVHIQLLKELPAWEDGIAERCAAHVRGRRQDSRLGLEFGTNQTVGNVQYHNT